MQWLSYADRELLLSTFDALKDAWTGSDEQLLSDASQWAKSLVPQFGFEYSLTRDVTTLSRYLASRHHGPDIADIARGGLLYVLQEPSNGHSKLGEFGLLDDAFVLSYAVHEIRMRLDDNATYNPPRLTADEQRHAEDLFLEMVDQPLDDDDALISLADKAVSALGNLSASGLFRRLQLNAAFLIDVLRDEKRSAEHRNFARAALNYLAAESDAIDDRLGIVGYLDDNFIAQMAVDLIDPQREPFLELLDATVAAWPFLSGLVIDEDSRVRPLSEYSIINAALCCHKVRGNYDKRDTLMIAPNAGPLPLLMGFFATLGIVQHSGQREVTEESFRDGQTVLVDHSDVVAEFAGFKTLEGRRMFGLRQYTRQGYYKSPSIHFWPISELRRLLPTSSARKPRGELVYDLGQSDRLLPGLEYLFNTSKAADLSTVEKQVIVVMPIGRARELCGQIRLYGNQLRDVVPTGHLSGNETVEAWSQRFGQQHPLLIFASDVDNACAYVEERTEKIELVVIDASSFRTPKPASLRRLKQLDIPVVCVATEKSVDGLSGSLGDGGIWEWSEGDLTALIWPNPAEPTSDGIITKYEERIRSRSAASLIVHRLSFPVAESAYNAVRDLAQTARRREEDKLPELDEVVTLAYGALSYLLRYPAVITPDSASSHEVEKKLATVLGHSEESRYLSEIEQASIRSAVDSLKSLFEALKARNPKAEKLSEIASQSAGFSLICPDARIRRDLKSQSDLSGLAVVDGVPGDNTELAGAIVPGWFRKERMAQLLLPPVTDPLHLLLYDVEAAWFHSFQFERRRLRTARASNSSRARLFPQVPGWGRSEPSKTTTRPAESTTSLEQLESVEEYVRDAYRRHVHSAAETVEGDQSAKAYFTIFEGGAHAFLTEFFRANIVTHLLDGANDAAENQQGVLQKPVSKLVPGDALLFNRGSQRDVIRVAADSILPAECRTTASLWRTALLKYVNDHAVTTEDIHEKLKQLGCTLQHNTIRWWLESEDTIAPQAYRRDVSLIAKVTSDSELTAKLDDVLAAISTVRGAHLKASRILASQIQASIGDILSDEGGSQSLIELESNIVIARILSIDHEPISVRKSVINRLLEDDRWL